MRFKPVPPPPDDVETVRAAQRAVLLVPGSETDCCTRIADRLDLASPDVARTWLTFLRGLGLVREGQRGFVRTTREPDRVVVAEGLRSGVFLASELLEALGDEPTTVEAAFEQVVGHVPRWERDKDHDWEGTWRARVESLLGWLVLAGLAEREASGYVRASEEE